MFVHYLKIKTAKKNSYSNIPDADYWTKKILDIKGDLKGLPEGPEKQRAFLRKEKNGNSLICSLY